MAPRHDHIDGVRALLARPRSRGSSAWPRGPARLPPFSLFSSELLMTRAEFGSASGGWRCRRGADGGDLRRRRRPCAPHLFAPARQRRSTPRREVGGGPARRWPRGVRADRGRRLAALGPARRRPSWCGHDWAIVSPAGLPAARARRLVPLARSSNPMRSCRLPPRSCRVACVSRWSRTRDPVGPRVTYLFTSGPPDHRSSCMCRLEPGHLACRPGRALVPGQSLRAEMADLFGFEPLDTTETPLVLHSTPTVVPMRRDAAPCRPGRRRGQYPFVPSRAPVSTRSRRPVHAG